MRGQEVCSIYNVCQVLWKNICLHTNSLNKKHEGCRFHTAYVYVIEKDFLDSKAKNEYQRLSIVLVGQPIEHT